MANVAQAKLCVKGYGKNFKALRENAKLTQEQLGDILHYSYKTISNIESEQRPPTNEQLLRYKNHFNVSLDYLTGHTTATDVNLSKDEKTFTKNDYWKAVGMALYNLDHQKQRPGDYSKYADLVTGECFAMNVGRLLFGEQEKMPKPDYNKDCYWYKEKMCIKNHGYIECGECKDYISKSAITDFVQDNLSKLLNG